MQYQCRRSTQKGHLRLRNTRARGLISWMTMMACLLMGCLCIAIRMMQATTAGGCLSLLVQRYFLVQQHKCLPSCAAAAVGSTISRTLYWYKSTNTDVVFYSWLDYLHADESARVMTEYEATPPSLSSDKKRVASSDYEGTPRKRRRQVVMCDYEAMPPRNYTSHTLPHTLPEDLEC